MKITKLLSLLYIGINSTSLLAQQDSAFKVCGTGRKNPYYYPAVQYYGEFKAIKQYYSRFYDSEKFKLLADNSGIVRIQFTINCKGETGLYAVENCDYNYKACNINEVIVEELLSLTKKLNGWIPAKDKQNETIDSHKFLAFKIKNGAIVDILPK
jgi:hypothetical protein